MTPSPKSLEEAHDIMIAHTTKGQGYDLSLTQHIALALDRREAEALEGAAKIAEEFLGFGPANEVNRATNKQAMAIAKAIRALIKPREGK